ncbi:AAA family ATPase [Lipingzhangella sp. LS1_29]|uniref:AAA family ATPase n=2 Tax=Lipingzhangella rawalii TaxID=2055835 RepID=A0ABU2H3W8_9ACTN|nr:AAA family ATPase [Lipingzhangella rawalii]
MVRSRREPRFVGRDTELAALHADGQQAAAGRGAATLITGDAGVGKSRLVREYQAGTSSVRAAAGHCPALGSDGLPFAPFVTVLRQLVRKTQPADTPGAGITHLRELARLLPELGEPPQRRDEQRTILFGEVLVLLECAARPQGLVVVLEDLHWADSSTRELLVFLLHNMTDLPLHLLVTCRSDELHRTHPMRRLLGELERLPVVRRVDVDPLSRDEVAEQAADLRGGSPLEPEQLDLVCARSGGNPLFVESFLEHGNAAGTEIPAAPRELLLGPLRSLDDTARQVVRAAAVGGHWIGHDLLAAVSGLSEDQLEAALDAAIGVNVLRIHGEGYAFRHALLAEAVRSTLLPGERMRLHRRYADTLENGATGLPPRQVATELAHHRYAAHDLPGALGAAWTAAQAAGEALAYPERSRMLERVLELWDQVPDAAQRTGTTHVEAVLLAARAAIRAGDPGRGADLADTGIAELTAGMTRHIDPATARADAVCLARLLHARGEANKDRAYDRALADLRQALRTLPQNHPDRTRFLGTLAADLMMRRDTVEALTVGEKALDQARAAQDERSEAEVLAVLGRMHGVDQENPDQGLEMLARARELSSRHGCPITELQTIQHTGIVLRLSGRSSDALRVYREGVRRARELRLPEEQTLGVVAALTELGELDAAEQEAEAAAATMRVPRHIETLEAQRAIIAIQRGSLERARRHLSVGGHLLPDESVRLSYVLPRSVIAVLLDLAEGRFEAARATVHELLDSPLWRQDVVHCWDLLDAGGELCYTARRDGSGEGPEWEALRQRLWSLVTKLPEPRIPELVNSKRGAQAYLCPDPATARDRFDVLAVRLERSERPVSQARMLTHAAEQACALGDQAGAHQRLDEAAALGAATGAHQVTHEARKLRERMTGAPSRVSPAVAGLTRREMEVLRLVAAGWSNPQIAAELSIAVKTVSVHVSNLLGKLGVPNRGAAAARARELGLDGSAPDASSSEDRQVTL